MYFSSKILTMSGTGKYISPHVNQLFTVKGSHAGVCMFAELGIFFMYNGFILLNN